MPQEKKALLIFILQTVRFVTQNVSGKCLSIFSVESRHCLAHACLHKLVKILCFPFATSLSCVLTARIFLLFDLLSAVQNICFIYS